MAADAALAVELADEAGQLLLAVRDRARRRRPGRAEGAGRPVQRRTCWPARLGELRPGDAVLSEEAADDPRAARPPTGSGSSTRWTAPASSPSRPARLGRPRRAVGGRRAGRRRGRAARRSAPSWPPTRPRVAARPARRRSAADRGQPDPPAGRGRARSPRALGAELVPMGSAGVQGRRRRARRGRRVRPRRRPVRVGLGRAGRRGPRRRAARLAGIDGSPLRYNQPDLLLPDLLVCRPELADRVLAAIAQVLDRSDDASRRATDAGDRPGRATTS